MNAHERSLFVVLVPAGQHPTALTQNVPADQTLGDLIAMLLAIPGAMKQAGAWGAAAEYRLFDLYSGALAPGLLVRQVPFPGCVLAVAAGVRLRDGDAVVEGDAAVETAARSIAMNLFAQRDDPEDRVMRRWLRFVASGLWRFEPTPVTAHDLSVVHHEDDAAVAADLVARLAAHGLRCRVRCIGADVGTGGGTAESMADDTRALAVVVGERHAHDPWIAFDVGAAWAAGLPVAPILVGRWKGPPPDILAPYQRVTWSTQRRRLIDELLAQLELRPWRPPPAPRKPSSKQADASSGEGARRRSRG